MHPGEPEETFESAEKAARRAIELDPAMAEPLTVLANLHEMRGDWVEADRLYEKALALDPEDPTSQFWRANNLSRAGYLCRGASAPAARPGPGSDERRRASLARVCSSPQQGQFEPALAAVAKAEELGCRKFRGYFGGLIRLAQGDGPGAVETLEPLFPAARHPDAGATTRGRGAG